MTRFVARADFVARFVTKFVTFVAKFIHKFVPSVTFVAACGKSSLNIRIADFVTDSLPNVCCTGSMYKNVAFVSGST